MSAAFDEMSSYLSILAEPIRIKILYALADGERSVGEIAEEVAGSQTNVSRHLALMYRSGVLSRRRDANQVFYGMKDALCLQLCRTVCSALIGRLQEGEPVRKDLQRVMTPRRPAPRRRVRGHL